MNSLQQIGTSTKAGTQAGTTWRGRGGRARRIACLVQTAVLAVALAACTTTQPPGPPDDDGQGTLVVLVNGLPTGATVAVSVTGPGGFDELLAASDTIRGLAVGSYAVTASDVSHAGVDYAAGVTGSPANVTANAVTTATVTYTAVSQAPGDLSVTITGLPGGVDAAVSVTGGTVNEQLTASGTLEDLTPGVYEVTAAEIDDGGDIYAATVTGSPATVPAGGSASVSVTYTFLDPAAFGSLAVTIDGLPGGTDAAVTVTGPGGFDVDLTSTGTLANLTPGNYDVSATDVTVGALAYTALIDTSPVLVLPDATTSVSVSYVPVAENDGDAQSNPGWSALFRATSGAPVEVTDVLFNAASPLDVKGIKLSNEIGNPADPGDWLAFELVHGQAPTSPVTFGLECLTDYDGTSPIRVELRDDSGKKIGSTVTCGGELAIAIPATGGSGDYLVSVLPTFTDPYFMRYELSIDAYCFQACVFQPYEP